MHFLSVTAIVSTFTASDGENLAVYDWPLPDRAPSRGTVLLVHGLGEHAGRYEHLARKLNGWGFAVRGYDQFGHGQSNGARGALSSNNRLIDDLADMVDAARAQMVRHKQKGLPLVLLGHSMGGLVAARFVARHTRPVDALVLSSPALNAGLGAAQKALLGLMWRVAPNLAVGNGLDANYLSHDPDVVAAYGADPLVHDRVTPRLARFIADAGPRVLYRARQWAVPTLLMYAGADRLVDPQGSQDFARAAPAGVVTARCFTALYHEIFNEPDNRAVFSQLHHWLDAQFKVK